MEKKNVYKQTLLYQQAMREKGMHNFGKMTKQEKNMNKMDLNAFRNKDSNMYSMVPGINNVNTVGTIPTIRIREPLELSTARSMEYLPKLYSNMEDHPVKDQIYNRSKPISPQKPTRELDLGMMWTLSTRKERGWTLQRRCRKTEFCMGTTPSRTPCLREESIPIRGSRMRRGS